MSLARLVVTAVRIEGRSVSAVARDYGLSRRWAHELVGRYDRDGEAGLAPRSRRPHTSPHATPAQIENRIVELRKQLTDQGLDAGAHTIAYHLDQQGLPAPSVATIWRILDRRGQVSAQPHKRPRSSWQRFEADQPNECWQADITHWTLGDGTEVEILNLLDDHARLALACHTRHVFKAADVLATVTTTITAYGLPTRVLTDNGAVFAGGPRGGGRVALEVTLAALGVAVRHSRPYHPPPAARSNASTRPSRNGWPANLAPQPSTSSKPSSTASATPTTPSARTAPSAGGRPPWPTPPAPKPSPPARSPSPHIPGSDATSSIPAASSPCATTAACTTSVSADATPAPASWSSFTTCTSGS
jgi:transposase InsO family protein